MKKSLQVLRYKEEPGWARYMDGLWGVKCLFKLRMGDWIWQMGDDSVRDRRIWRVREVCANKG